MSVEYKSTPGWQRLSEEELKSLALKVAEWAASEEGREALQRSMTLAAETIKELEAARKCTWEQLNTPMDI